MKRKNIAVITGASSGIGREFARQIGADAYTDNAYDAAQVAKTYIL